jgi:hypothetical protein
MIQENRSLTRDLMEVPEALTIKVSPVAVTFIDDLERQRTYPTSGERQRIQLGAARFNAAAFWTGSQLEKRIDAADGFRMTEIFLSADARRIFVIRVGSNRKARPSWASIASTIAATRRAHHSGPSAEPSVSSDFAPLPHVHRARCGWLSNQPGGLC